MLWGGSQGGLELRQENGGTVRVAGRFPYGSVTVLYDGGRSGQARKEQIAPRAFRSRIDTGADILFLSGHDMEKPLASREAGTLTVEDSDDALTFEARIAPELQGVGHVRDFLCTLRAGLVRGLSPGFRVANEDRAETITSDGNGILRTVNAAELFEISAVTKPAYSEAQIEARNWEHGQICTPSSDIRSILNRWRV